MKDGNNFLKSILAYAKTKGIMINKEAFSFRLCTHPNYPNLLSAIDTLEYFEIDHDAYQVDFKDINSLPNEFLTLLRGPYRQKNLHSISKRNDSYYIDNKETSLSDLQKRWNGIVIVFNEGSPRKQSAIEKKKNLKSFILPFVFVLLFTLYNTYENVWNNLFYIFSAAGFILSLVALKDLFKIENPVINKFCSASSDQYITESDCDLVTNSKKWKILEKINYSDFSLLFFLSQIILYPIMSLSGYVQEYFNYQSIALYASIPLLLSSLYFQKYIIKKWCVICLGIISVTAVELLLTGFIIKPSFYFNLPSLNLFLIINSILIIGWIIVKQKLSQFNLLKDFQIRTTRFIRNYSLFKNTILEGKKFDIPFGSSGPDNDKKLTITLITNPFCDYCKKAHFAIEKIIKKHHDKVTRDVILNVDIHDEYDNDKLVCQKMMTMLLKRQNQKFITSLNEWFEHENVSDWLEKYKSIDIDSTKTDNAFETQKNWCIQNQKDFTPALFINGYLYPLIYDMENLDYFIQDLVNDSDFSHEEYQYASDLKLA